jgi:preprotein translocase subunit SecD
MIKNLQQLNFRVILNIVFCLLALYIALPNLFPNLRDGNYAKFFAKPSISLGLDLKGGVALLLEVDTKQYKADHMNMIAMQIRSKLFSDKIPIKGVEIKKDYIVIDGVEKQNVKQIKQVIHSLFGAGAQIEESNNKLQVSLEETDMKALMDGLISQTIEIVRRRIDETGTKEIDIQRQGEDYILLQVPGLYDPTQIKHVLGKTAKLSLHLVDNNALSKGEYSADIRWLQLEGSGATSSVIPIQGRSLITGDMLTDAQVAVHMSAPVVLFKLSNVGAKIFGEVTKKNTGKQLAIVLDNKIISAPIINEPILGGSGSISGNFSIETANELALLLRAGALPAQIKIAEERSVGPSLGVDSIEAGTQAAITGVIFVIVIMLVLYGWMGVIANIALVMNLIILVAILCLFNVTLTMPGIAGMVLTLGMAVDANVLIFERIIEELRKGRHRNIAIENGYKLAFGSIFDSNVTTIAAALILYLAGNGPVKGFALTLIIGITCSMYTAIVLTKMMTKKFLRNHYVTTR